MKEDRNSLEWILRSQEARTAEIDVTGPVMQRIHAWHEKERNKAKRFAAASLRRRRVGIALLLLFLASAVSVSAAVLYQAKWNGIQISIDSSDKQSLAARSPNHTKISWKKG
ncbi:hypothetical protein LJK87_41650 [Paenibacillus sp. P25]|nr:hypothetical protein LJK87_41650 [Paenibacillus sp. P25]